MTAKNSTLPKGITKLPTGVEIHGRYIRIWFRYKNRRFREPLRNLNITAASIRYAARKRATLLHQIETNSFDYTKTFPDSPNAKEFPALAPNTVGQALDRWLEIKTKKCAPSTVRGYEKDIRVHLQPRWGEYQFSEIKKTDLEYWLEHELHALRPKTINNLAMPLRSVITDACLDGLINKNPFDKIGYMDNDRTEADPFTGDELYTLFTTPSHRQQELNYVEFACFSGVSTSEGIALAWEDIDWKQRTISIERACVLGQYKRPKTDKRRRVIKLFDQAYDALLRQKKLTFLLPESEIQVLEKRNKKTTQESLRFVFLNSLTNKPFTDSKELEKFWVHHLRKTGLRRRGINQCRHTFASRLLTTGKYPEKWIADYLGHTSTAMLHKHYGKLVKADRPNLEKQASADIAIAPIHKKVA